MSAPLQAVEIDLEKALQQALERQFSRAGTSPEITPPNLSECIRYSLLSPGKRIRPRLSLACAEMIGLPVQLAISPALALEMIHCFTLIHDDLPCMDDDDFRRGRPSNHKVFGESLALLAGDALISIALDTFLEVAEQVPAKNLTRALRRFNAAMGARGVIGGQAAESLLGEKSRLEELSRMHAQKTGALFSAALLVPMDLAGIDEFSAEGRALETFASEIGLAFQIADDLEDAATETTTPTSILFYMSTEQAAKQTLERLEKASQTLTDAWKMRALSLTPFAQEISRKIQNA